MSSLVLKICQKASYDVLTAGATADAGRSEREKVRVNHVSPGVRRLCVCVGAPQPRLLDVACGLAGGGRLYTEHADGLDLGFASPGVDEAALVTELIAALRTAMTSDARPTGPAFAVFHVGITRVEGDDLGGAAVTQVKGLLGALTREVAPAGAALAVGISSGLFDDIRTECGFNIGWRPMNPVGAWLRVYP